MIGEVLSFLARELTQFHVFKTCGATKFLQDLCIFFQTPSLSPQLILPLPLSNHQIKDITAVAKGLRLVQVGVS